VGLIERLDKARADGGHSVTTRTYDLNDPEATTDEYWRDYRGDDPECDATDATECAMMRERSVAGVSDTLPECPIHRPTFTYQSTVCDACDGTSNGELDGPCPHYQRPVQDYRRPVQSPFTRRAAEGTLPAKVLR
jgi:hypothetical protein